MTTNERHAASPVGAAVSSPRFLHVANGTATTEIIEAAGIPGARSIWADVLYEGPVPAGLSDDELREVRARFLASPGAAAIDPMNDLRRWRQVIEDRGSYDELVLWFEHDLFDQLNLIQILTWIRSRVPVDRVSLICIGSFPERSRFKGLGELSPAELSSLLDTRRRVGSAEYDVAERAWRAFREPTPGSLDDLRRSGTTALPYLAPALERFLQEYPSTIDGLSRSERRLLQLAADGPIALMKAFPRMQDGESAYYITGGSLASTAEMLSRTTPPLITLTDDAAAGRSILSATIELTDAGRDVLAGRRDRVACGVDRWLGGVHLQSGGPIWRWDAESGRVRRDRSA